MEITAFDLASRFIGIKEIRGAESNPFVLAWLRLDDPGMENDETPWCSAFVNFIAWELRLPRSKSLTARSWLGVGMPVDLADAVSGFDVVVFSRGICPPGPEVLHAPGHVGFFARLEGSSVWVVGGNQGDAVTMQPFEVNRVLGVRRLLT